MTEPWQPASTAPDGMNMQTRGPGGIERNLYHACPGHGPGVGGGLWLAAGAGKAPADPPDWWRPFPGAKRDGDTAHTERTA